MDKRRENLIAIVALATLVVACLLILAPFLSSVIWAVVICFSTWGLYERLIDALGGRERLAAAVMTALLAGVLLGPLIIVAASMGDNAENLARAVQRWSQSETDTLPGWIVNLPWIGPRLQEFWAAFDVNKLFSYLRSLAAPIGRMALDAGLALGQGILYLGLSVLMAYFLYRDGHDVAARLRTGMERIAGARAHHLLEVAGGTVKSVVHGIIGAALAQGVMAGLGYWIAGVPGPFLLGLFTCVLALIYMGPALIWIPAAVWLFHEGHPGWAVFMLIWGFTAISSIDNLLRPYLISQGSRLPFILVLLGVVGGVLRFGVIGVFLGPTLLAVGYALIVDWTQSTRSTPEAKGATEHRGAGAPLA